ncbi:MAG: hypothetical protein D6740_05635, partial [Alphaproteobacteria bacterium]
MLLAVLPRMLPGGADVRIDLAAFAHGRAVLRDVAFALAWEPQHLPRLSGGGKFPDGGRMEVTARLVQQQGSQSPILRIETRAELLRADRTLPALGVIPPGPLRDGRHLQLVMRADWGAQQARFAPLTITWDDRRLEARLTLARQQGGRLQAELDADLPAFTLPASPAREHGADAIAGPHVLLAPLGELLAGWPEELALAYRLRLPALDISDVAVRDIVAAGALTTAEGVTIKQLTGGLGGLRFALSGRYQGGRKDHALTLAGTVRIHQPHRLAAVAGRPDLASLFGRLPARWQVAVDLDEKNVRAKLGGADSTTRIAGEGEISWQEGKNPVLALDADITTQQLSRLLVPPIPAADDRMSRVARSLGDHAQLHLSASGRFSASGLAGQGTLRMEGSLLGARTQLSLLLPDRQGGTAADRRDVAIRWQV